ncbi:hypothetical protein IFM89_015931 [Coptis chinensis]|uniref:DUF4283 domain-containing protein n=1 Tax=Coptis chinensis TaxID=261450 RepID=A0A835HEX4_9MAGN|nr:hypothetical protein IFM89_015931 [Coptis chinensis]
MVTSFAPPQSSSSPQPFHWSSLFQNDKSILATLNSVLEPCTPSFEEGAAVVPQDVIAVGIAEWEDMLIGYFLDKRMSFPFVKNVLEKTSKLKGSMDITIDRDLFYICFTASEDKQVVLKGGPIFIAGKIFVVMPWSPEAENQRNNVTTVPIWAKLSKVSKELWTKKGLSFLASLVGVLSIRGKHVFVDVEYPWKPPSCSRCCRFGHLTARCPTAPTQVWVPRTSLIREQNPSAAAPAAGLSSQNVATLSFSDPAGSDVLSTTNVAVDNRESPSSARTSARHQHDLQPPPPLLDAVVSRESPSTANTAAVASAGPSSQVDINRCYSVPAGPEDMPSTNGLVVTRVSSSSDRMPARSPTSLGEESDWNFSLSFGEFRHTFSGSQNSWVVNPAFKDTLLKCWSIPRHGNPSFMLCKKLKLFKEALKGWPKFSSTDLQNQVVAARANLEDIQMQMQKRPFDTHLF